MESFVRRLSLGLALLALTMALVVPAQAGCGEACYDVTCVPDAPDIGCVEQWGYCWEVPCGGWFADSEGCPVDEALTKAFASFGDVTGAEALEMLRSDAKYAEEILPYVRIVGEDGEVFRGAKYQRRDSDTKLAETEAQDESAKPADR